MRGLYFYKLVSPYKEDLTKDCKLTINEIDSNFITLKDADIKSFTFDENTNKLILTRNSKDEQPLVADLSPLAEGVVHNLYVAYDKEKGEIKITWDDNVAIIDGLITKKNVGTYMLTHVNSDSTLVGLGTEHCPLGINVVDRTGVYRPCIKYLNIAGGEFLPKPCDVEKGDRYVTRECVSEYGYLYDYKAVQAINEDLKFGWRVPTKEDWDGMLNAVEPCECDRNHASTVCNKEFGRCAGKVLKSMSDWDECESGDCGCMSSEDRCRCKKEDLFEPVDDNCYHYNKRDGNCFEFHPKRKPCDSKGLDKFGLKLLPAGYGDGCELKNYLGKRGSFWTSTAINNTDVYAKRFDYDKSGVVQVAAAPHAIMSIRLVKDYDGSNFHDVEYINGSVFRCVLMPSLTAKSGYLIWTINNVAFDDPRYCPQEIDIVDYAFNIQLFTTEWNGFFWVKKRLEEGECVVLFDGLEDDEYSLYMVKNGELVSVASKIYEDIYEKFEQFIQEINGRLDEEIETRQASDEVFSGAIEDLRSIIESGTSEITSAITELSGTVEEIIDQISGITDEIDTLSGDVATLQEELSGETEARQAADEALSGAIEDLSSEVQEIASEVEALSGALETEISDRQAADEALSGAIEDVSSELAEEIERAKEREDDIESRLISRGEYNSESGVLTLFKESEETIEVQFNGNYGTF